MKSEFIPSVQLRILGDYVITIGLNFFAFIIYISRAKTMFGLFFYPSSPRIIAFSPSAITLGFISKHLVDMA